MEVTRVIPTSDGRLIEVTEGSLKAPPPVPPKKYKGPYKRALTRRASWGRAQWDKRGKKHHRVILQKTFPGYAEWLTTRIGQVRKLHMELKNARTLGCATGLTKQQSDVIWEVARRRAKEDMANLKKAGIVDNAASEEALTTALEVMRGPQSQQIRLAAARMVLEWTKAKPAAKSEVTVNAAEAWLEKIAENGEGM